MKETTNNSNTGSTLDIIIPVYNEAEVIPLLINELDITFSKENQSLYKLSKVTYIFVNDGSKDNSVEILTKTVGTSFNSSKIVKLSRNFGHQPAVTAGLSVSSADYAAIIDADLQDPPHTILEMISKMRTGYDVVYGIRKNRKESFIIVFLYWIFYRFWNFLSPINVPLDSGDFCLLSRKVIAEFNKFPEVLKFPRGLRAWLGFRQVGHEYNREMRKAGESKYNLKSLYTLATDGIAWISLRPLKLAQLISLIFFVLSFFLLILLLAGFFKQENILNSILLILNFILFGNSLIMFTLYIQGAYIGRTYIESKKRPFFIIDNIDEHLK